MKAAVASIYDINNPRYWSGTIKYMTKGLIEQDIEIVQPKNIKIKYYNYFRGKSYFKKKILKSLYFSEREPYILKSYAKQFQENLNQNDYDFIFAPQTSELLHIDIDKPKVFWVDATMDALLIQLNNRIRMNKRAIELGHYTDRMVYSKVDAAIFSSDWAAKSAIDVYGIDKSKVHVVPFGANLDSYLTYEEISNAIQNRSTNKFKIIFIAVNWEQKGGDIVVDTLNKLDHNKIELHVIGDRPKIKGEFPSYLKYHGYISKNNPEQLAKMTKLLLESHLMFMPSRQEAYGIVICEANSFGIPVISSNIGGITTIIEQGKNGFLYNLNPDKDEIAAKIEFLMNNEDEYRNIAFESYRQFTERLNWRTSCKKVKDIIKTLIK